MSIPVLRIVYWLLFFPLFIMLIYAFFRIITRNNQTSSQAELFNLALELFKPRILLKTVLLNPSRTSHPLMASERFSKKYETNYHIIDGTEYITSKPDAENNIHLVYLHGGAYVLGNNGVKKYESFISRLIEATDSKVTFVDYPVAPESKYTQTIEKTYQVYKYLRQEYPSDRFILVGDSAGGGLALVLAQLVGERNNCYSPEKLVLFSPWLDLSLDNPEIIADKDMILSKEALLYAAQQYSGHNELKNPHVSPIYGSFRGIGPTLMFFGSLELFYADGLKLQKIATKNNYKIDFRFYDMMPHDWVIFSIPEADEALRETSEFIAR